MNPVVSRTMDAAQRRLFKRGSDLQPNLPVRNLAADDMVIRFRNDEPLVIANCLKAFPMVVLTASSMLLLDYPVNTSIL